MFIRKSVTKNKKTKTEYVTHKLVESYRNVDGKPRQRVVMSLGKIELSKKRWPELASLLEARITGQVSFLESDEEISEIADTALKHNEFIEKKPKRAEKLILDGCYVIETSQKNLSAKEIWSQYMELNHVENSFRDLKSELGMRPIYHSKEKRTDAHLFISVLAYHILNTIEFNLKANGDTRSWKSINEILSTHQRSTVALKDKNKEFIYIRISGTPEGTHNEIYRMLKINDSLKRKIYKEKQRL